MDSTSGKNDARDITGDGWGADDAVLAGQPTISLEQVCEWTYPSKRRSARIPYVCDNISYVRDHILLKELVRLRRLYHRENLREVFRKRDETERSQMEPEPQSLPEALAALDDALAELSRLRGEVALLRGQLATAKALGSANK